MTLFKPIELRGVTIRNRIVKSAMAEGCADGDGKPTPKLVRMYERWAKGGVGLAITGMAHVRRGYSFSGEMGLYDDELVEPLRRLTDATHQHGGRVFAQLCHAPPQIPRAKARALGAVAPSAGMCFTNWLVQRAIESDELHRLTGEFGQAARRAREAGFDGVQLHAAHGYLLSRSLSPRFNRRQDRWGGSFDGRLRFLEEVYHQVRAAVGDDYPVTIKLNAHDGQRGGLDLETSLRVARRLEAWGIDAIEVSAGVGDVGLGIYPSRGELPIDLCKRWLRQELPFMGLLGPALGPLIRLLTRSVRFVEEAYFFDLARRFADELSVPILCVGGIRSRAVAEQILNTSKVAMVSIARPLVRQPGLVRDWQRDRSLEASCVSCNRCFVSLGLEQPLRCWYRGPGSSPASR
ncbi:MAG: NADH:flavin oxidoreductase [Deltaproteobacteria bacterium]|nr:NADH:flavin oxidoreductase [Deltaproteobacteria bacterium]